MSAGSDPQFASDDRWQLAQRIAASPPFQRAEKLRALLLYVVETAIRGESGSLTEQRIGHAVFGKAADYSPVEDSSVRANARLLRLRLHEYYDSFGRSESLVLDLPKGSYAPAFRPVEAPAPAVVFSPAAVVSEAPVQAPPVRKRRPWWLLGAAGLVLLAVGFIAGQFEAKSAASHVRPPWPLSEVYDPDERTQVIISDINYGLFSILSNHGVTLEQYIGPQYPGLLTPSDASPREARMVDHLRRTSFVSYADTVMTNRILSALGGKSKRVWVRSARDVKSRDLAEGDFILIGSPASNPWVSLFEDRLNFVEKKEAISPSYFLNKSPRAGERDRYLGIPRTGSSGADYATVALLPSKSGKGRVIILQGLQQDGTESAGLMLTTESGRETLRKALNVPDTSSRGTMYFEALIESKAVGGSSAGTSVVATRVLQ